MSESSQESEVVAASFSDGSMDEGEGQWDVLGRSAPPLPPLHECWDVMFCVQDEFREAF